MILVLQLVNCVFVFVQILCLSTASLQYPCSSDLLLFLTPCGKRATFSDTSKNSKVKLNRQLTDIYDVFGQMEVRNTSLIHSRHTFNLLLFLTPCGKTVKCSDTSKNSKAKSKRILADIYDVFSQMEVRNTSPIHSRHTFDKRAFNKNFHVDIHRNRTEWPNAKIGTSSKQQGPSEREAFAQAILGKS